jgi:hypothetical protein
MKTIERNKNFVNDITSNNEGIRKQASADFNQWLRTYQRQDGVFRKLMPPVPVTEEDFAETIETRDPMIIRTMYPRSAGAISTNFDTGTISTGMYTDKYTVYIHRAWTPKYRIDKAYLAAYKNDLLGAFKDLSLQDLLAVEDVEGMSLVNSIVGDIAEGENHGEINEEIGIRQNINLGSVVSPDSITLAVKGLTMSNDNISPAKALVHRSFWYELINAMKADTYGDRLAEQAITGNMKELEENLLGIKWFTCLERKLVPYNTMYIFAGQEYCGDFLTWGEAEIFSELKDGIWFEMFGHEQYGMSMPYSGCVVRANFAGTASNWQ